LVSDDAVDEEEALYYLVVHPLVASSWTLDGRKMASSSSSSFVIVEAALSFPKDEVDTSFALVVVAVVGDEALSLAVVVNVVS
jgi:hypothetical protein